MPYIGICLWLKKLFHDFIAKPLSFLKDGRATLDEIGDEVGRNSLVRVLKPILKKFSPVSGGLMDSTKLRQFWPFQLLIIGAFTLCEFWPIHQENKLFADGRAAITVGMVDDKQSYRKESCAWWHEVRYSYQVGGFTYGGFYSGGREELRSVNKGDFLQVRYALTSPEKSRPATVRYNTTWVALGTWVGFLLMAAGVAGLGHRLWRRLNTPISRNVGQVATVEKIEIGLPDKFELFHRGSYIEITWKWFRWRIVFITVNAIIWSGLLFNAYSEAGKSMEWLVKPMVVYFLHGAIGIGLMYYIVAGWFNRTHIFVTRGRVVVRHGPIPWLGNKELKVSNLKQLYAKEKIREGSVTYEVYYITHSGRNIKLFSGLKTKEQALHIEQEIEKYLGIEDIAVKGEIRECYG